MSTTPIFAPADADTRLRDAMAVRAAIGHAAEAAAERDDHGSALADQYRGACHAVALALFCDEPTALLDGLEVEYLTESDDFRTGFDAVAEAVAAAGSGVLTACARRWSDQHAAIRDALVGSGA